MVTFDEALELIDEDECDGTTTEKVPIAVKYDMGWQKRASGRKYNSLSGVGVMIGAQSGKVIDYGIRCKDCRMCTIHNTNGTTPPDHKCFKNFTGSSRSMEADVAGNIVSKLESTNDVQVETLIMDDDSTTYSRIRSEVAHDIRKVSDIAHVKCNVTSSLYKLQSKHSVLSTAVIRYLVDKCFTYAVLQNKGSTENTRAAIENIVPHNFGNHEKCGAWCAYFKHPETYTHKYLPSGKPLKGAQLQKDLSDVFAKYAVNADKISPCASTSECESFNSIVASKAPKSRHLSSSGSLSARVACAVCQKNEGSGYMAGVFQNAGMSPGKLYGKHSEKADKTRKYTGEYKRSVAVKRRRLTFKKEKSAEQASNELREGRTYESNVDMEPISNEDITAIPCPIESPNYQPVKCESPNLIYFDLETTSLERSCDLVQLSAVSDSRKFDVYVLPNKPISAKSTEITGLAVRDEKLFLHNTEVSCVKTHECVEKFIAWCKTIGKNVILVAHNCKIFDAPRLVSAVQLCDKLQEFCEVVVGFSDTLSTLKEAYRGEIKGFSQQNLVKKILHKDYDAHNALADASLLKELVEESKVEECDLVRHSFSVQSIVLCNVRWEEKCRNEQSLGILLENKICSPGIVGKIASSGLKFTDLCLAYRRNGLTGLTVLLSERDINGRLRVTKSRKIIQQLFDFILKLDC